jgi:flagellar basal-body rod modification protein FlgD
MATITQISNGTSLAGVSGTKVATSASATASTTTTAASDKAKSLKNQFLSILLTQMQHQNPLDPMDTKEFTGQLTQFSALEQQIDTNTNLEKMLGALNQSSLSSAFGYIGQTVDVATASTAVQDKSANWTYAIPSDAKSVGISVTDSTGKIVYSGAMQNSAGGSAINAGTYSLNLKDADLTRATKDGEVLKVAITLQDSAGKTMKDSAGKDITADIHTAVKVDSVQSDTTGTFLQAGGMLFQIGDVNKIVKPAATTTTSSAPATDTTSTTNTGTTT